MELQVWLMRRQYASNAFAVASASSFGGVAATPLRLRKTEALLEGEAPSESLLGRALVSMQEEIEPLSDVRGSSAFRRLLAEGLMRRFFREKLGVNA